MRGNGALVGLGLAALLAGGLAAAAQEPDVRARRTAERLQALQKEADALAARGRTLLGDLRKLELERQISIEQLAAIEQDRLAVEQQIEDAEQRAAVLAQAAASQLPAVEAQLVQLYRQGRAGYWRLLLDAEDLRAVGRAYRTALMLTALARTQIETHYRTLDALTEERKALQARADAIAALEGKAARARTALDAAVAARRALVRSIDDRRDLNAQLIGELQLAQQQLQTSLVQLGSTSTAVLPIGPFRGDLPWPARGAVARPFGRQADAPGAAVSNGMEIAVADGQPVRAVHDGTVAFAGPFAGYGNLVILDHGARSHSLYGYLHRVDVATGERVDAQAPVGTSGRNPGGTPALYFELRVDGTAVDPLQWLRR